MFTDTYLRVDTKDYSLNSTLESNEKRINAVKVVNGTGKSMNSIEETAKELRENPTGNFTQLNVGIVQSVHMWSVVSGNIAGSKAKFISPMITQNDMGIEGFGSATSESGAKAVPSLNSSL